MAEQSSGIDMAKVRELMSDPDIQAIVAEAPPLPDDAIHLLRANDCPVLKRSEGQAA